ncbi:type II toxin-antitoxin system RelE/ParE family toxin [Alteromonas sp. KUL150]|uniref:type II toxin-antitoxin system RelE/ParE family toxin n=1 Tax=Alteromonas sp. KUL150 TaxID=2480805 RepID=UPI001F1F33E2|nr:type II toxin-antitoxin system RelE/ParE family toxin [Alteromonas sp. KUL150]
MKHLTTIEYSIKVTPVFKLCLKKLDAFLTRKFNHNVANEAKRAIKSKVKSQLSVNPYSAPHSDRLLELGLTEYRQLLVDSHNVVLYRVEDSTKTVILLLVFDSRQDLKKLLFEVNLLV